MKFTISSIIVVARRVFWDPLLHLFLREPEHLLISPQGHQHPNYYLVSSHSHTRLSIWNSGPECYGYEFSPSSHIRPSAFRLLPLRYPHQLHFHHLRIYMFRIFVFPIFSYLFSHLMFGFVGAQ